MSRLSQVASICLCATFCIALAERADGQPITKMEAVITIREISLIRENSVTAVRVPSFGLNFEPIAELNDVPPAAPLGVSLVDDILFVITSWSHVDGLTTYSGDAGWLRKQLWDGGVGGALFEMKITQLSVSAARPNVLVLSGTESPPFTSLETFDFSPFSAGGKFSLSIPLPDNVSATAMLAYAGTACAWPGCSVLNQSVGASLVQEAAGPPVPEPVCVYSFSGGSGVSAVRFCVTQQGTIAQLSGPEGQEHVSVAQVWEGYVVCTGAVAQAWDLGLTQSGFGAAILLSPPTSASVSIRRSSAQFQLDQVFKLDKAQKAILVTSTLTNISGAALSDVRLARAYDPDINGDADDLEVRSARGVWAGDLNAVSLTGITWAMRTDTAIGGTTAPVCSAESATAPAITDDASLASVTYRLGNMAAGTKRTVVHVYRIQ